MDTPIADFITSYVGKDVSRLHMPGHKGSPDIAGAVRDITEVAGTDDLISMSEKNASSIFSCPTYYSAEGSSLCIRAMCNIVTELTGKRVIVASRNVHQSFITACALLDIEVVWLPFQGGDHLFYQTSCEDVARVLEHTDPACVYITSPDYLGMVSDIGSIAAVCHDHGTLLAADNAHGAYLKFFGSHPMELGADICCDSAHKTLPVLTGGAYLHITPELSKRTDVRRSLSLFSSTSPSWLILESLDRANGIMADPSFASSLKKTASKVEKIREAFPGISYGNEYLKLTILPDKLGYTGFELGNILREGRIEPEMSDLTAVTFMFSPYNTDCDFESLMKILTGIEKKPPLDLMLPPVPHPVRKMSIRDAVLARSVELPAEQAAGKTASLMKISCPPAIPIVIAGELITEEHVLALKAFGHDRISVVSEG